MKILMISPQPFFEPRGTPISVYQRLEALSALGHEIDLITYHVGKDVDFPNVKIHRVRGLKVIQHVRIGPSRAKILLDVQIFFRAIRMLLGKRYDVIHSHEEAAFFSMFLGWIFRTRHLYDMHSVLSRQLTNFSFSNKSIFVRIFEFLERMVLTSCHAVITVGPDLEQYVKLAGKNIRVVMIENIALHAYQTPVQQEMVEELKRKLNLEGRFPIVYTGTYERYQGLGMALECVNHVRQRYPNAIFILVGGPYSFSGCRLPGRRNGISRLCLSVDLSTPRWHLHTVENLQLPACRKTHHCHQHHFSYPSVDQRHRAPRRAQSACLC